MVYGGTSAVTTLPVAMIAPWPMVTPGMIVHPWPNHTSWPTTVSPRLGMPRTRSRVRSAHWPPNMVNGNVDTPIVGWLAPAMRNRVPVAIAQYLPITSRSGP